MNKIDELAIKYKSNDLSRRSSERIRAEVIENSQGYISSILKKTNVPRNTSYDYEDLKQEANIMVLKALENFDPNNGAKFSTYMYLRVSGRIISYIRKYDVLPRGKRKKLGEMRETRHNLEQSLGRSVSDQEVATEMSMSSGDVKTLTEATALRQSGANDYDSGTSREIIDNSLEAKFERDWILWKLSNLPVRDRVLLVSMYMLDLDGRECAVLLDYNDRHYIYRLKNKILNNLE